MRHHKSRQFIALDTVRVPFLYITQPSKRCNEFMSDWCEVSECSQWFPSHLTTLKFIMALTTSSAKILSFLGIFDILSPSLPPTYLTIDVLFIFHVLFLCIHKMLMFSWGFFFFFKILDHTWRFHSLPWFKMI